MKCLYYTTITYNGVYWQLGILNQTDDSACQVQTIPAVGSSSWHMYTNCPGNWGKCCMWLE